MYIITTDISGTIYEYAGEGQWTRGEGLRFTTEAEAQARLDADRWRLNPKMPTPLVSEL